MTELFDVLVEVYVPFEDTWTDISTRCNGCSVPCYSARQDASCFRNKIYILSRLVEDPEVRAVDPHTSIGN